MNDLFSSLPAPISAPATHTFIEERRKNSHFWQTVHLLGSLQLALILLGILVLACAVATFTEAQFNTQLAHTKIYKAPWFLFWLALLCVNLFCVTLTRWPWQKKHVGFVITHYGIITLLVGAGIGTTWGLEGNVVLRKGGPPVDQVITRSTMLQIQSSPSGLFYRIPFDMEASPPSASRKRYFSVPGTALQIVAEAVSSSLHEQPELLASLGAHPGVFLEFTSTLMKTSIKVPLLLHSDPWGKSDFFGLAQIAFLPSLPDRAPRLVSETRFVFSHYPAVIQAPQGSTGLGVELSAEGSHLTFTDERHHTHTVLVSEALKHPILLGETSVQVEAYWPDFSMRQGNPTTISLDPKNPTVLLRLLGPKRDNSQKPLLEIAPAQENGFHYQLSRGGVFYASGKLKKDSSFATGWADWKVRVLSLLPSARLTFRLEPSAEPGITGFAAFLKSPDGTCGEKAWIAPGFLTSLFHRDGGVHIAYGLEKKGLPFSIRLQSFEVPRYEGTELPSNFIAKVEFHDTRTGKYQEAIAQMNQPASFPGGWWAIASGLNYKFSQAQWNPSDLRETTLQVLYDPGWFFKWTGSLSICIGIALLFFFRRPKRT